MTLTAETIARAPPLRLHNSVVPLLFTVAAAAMLGCGFVALAPNRLVSGRPIGLFAAADGRLCAAIASFGFLLLAGAVVPPRRALHRAAAFAASVLLLAVLGAAGQAAAALAAAAPALARISLGAGFWLLLGASALAIVDALQRAGGRHRRTARVGRRDRRGGRRIAWAGASTRCRSPANTAPAKPFLPLR